MFREGKIVGVVELTKDLTTAGHVEEKKEYLKSLSREKGFRPNRENNEKITFDDILTLNEDLLNTIEQAKVFALSPNPTLIYGETGTGKELFAQAMINYAAGPKQKIIIQNCAAVPEKRSNRSSLERRRVRIPAPRIKRDSLKRPTAEFSFWMN